MLTEYVIKKLLFSKHLQSLAEENMIVDNVTKLSSGVILLQDSVEIFLLALAEHLQIPLPQETNFYGYFKEINKGLSKKSSAEQLPLSNQLSKLNRIRVDIKHHGIQPALEECKHFIISVRDFYEEVSLKHFGKPYGSISLIDLLDEGKSKDFLTESVKLYENGEYKDCLINCRKAIYVEIERDYSIERRELAPSLSDSPLAIEFSYYGHKSPSYARYTDYAEKYVQDPSDYIVFDRDSINIELMRYGIEYNDFWNVLRLTPKVFYSENNNRWIVKHQFDKLQLDEDVLKNNAEFSLRKTIEIILIIHRNKQSIKTIERDKFFYIDLKSPEVQVFEKADKGSRAVAVTPAGLRRIDCDFYIEGLDKNDTYYHVMHSDDKQKVYFMGYIHEDDVI